MTLAELRHASALKVKEAKEMLTATGGAGLTPEQRTKWDALHTEAQGYDQRADDMQRQADADAQVEERAKQKLTKTVDAPAVIHTLSGDGPILPVFRRHSGQEVSFEVRTVDQFWEGVLTRKVEGRAFSMGTGEEGGYLMPKQFRPTILEFQQEGAIVRPRATVIPAGEPPDAAIDIPVFAQGAAGASGGLAVSWVSEGGTKADTTAEFEQLTLTPRECCASITITDKLLRNSAAAGPFLNQKLRQVIINSEEYNFVMGPGTTRPLGVLHASTTGSKTVARAVASNISFADVSAMRMGLIPEGLSRAVWVASVSAMDEIVRLADDNGNSIFIVGNIQNGVGDRLLGIPIVWSGRTPALGTKGDLSLCDFQAYIIKDGSGPFVEASPHVYWTTNKTVVKCFWLVDGALYNQAPLELENGSTTVSPIVVLTDAS